MIDFKIRECVYKKSTRKRKKFSKGRNFLKKYEGSHISHKRLQKLVGYWGRGKKVIPYLTTIDEFFASYEGRDFQEACEEFIKRYKKSRTNYKLKYPLAAIYTQYLSGHTSYRFKFYKDNFGIIFLSASGRLGILKDGTIKSFDFPSTSRGVTDRYYSFVKLRRQKEDYVSYNNRFLNTYMNRINPDSNWIQPLGKLFVVDLVTKKIIPEPKMTYVIKARMYSGRYVECLPKLSVVLSTYTRVGIAGEKTIGIMARERKDNYHVYYTLIKNPYVR